MVQTGAKLTLKEFLALPEGDLAFEFAAGQAVPKLSPKYFHSTLQRALLTLIGVWCRGKGRVLPEWAVSLKREGEDWMPIPDLTYISYNRLPKTWRQNAPCPQPPELVIEIRSPDQTLKEFDDKAKDYLNAGVSRVWVIDPESQTFCVFAPDRSPQSYSDTAAIIDTLLPGLELSPRQVFEEADLV